MSFLIPEEAFSIHYGETTLHIHPIPELQDRVGFMVFFSSRRKPLCLIRAIDHNGLRFWTSMPEGRQMEAEGVGKLIEEYFKTTPPDSI